MNDLNGVSSDTCILQIIIQQKLQVDLLLIGEEGKRHYVLIKDFNTFMCDHILHDALAIGYQN